MKITWLKGDLTAHKIITLDKFINSLKNDQPTRSFMNYREMVPFLTPGSCPADLEKVPAVIFSSGYRNGGWLHYNGLVLLEYKQLPSYEEACRLKNQIIMYTQPFMAFIGSSGHSVKVVLRYSLPDGSLPSTEENAARFHEWAYRRAVSYYQAQFQYPVTITEPVLNRTCRISFDSGAWYYPDAPVIRMEQPFGSAGEKQPRPLKTGNRQQATFR